MDLADSLDQSAHDARKLLALAELQTLALLAVEWACVPGEHEDPPAEADVCKRDRWHARGCLTDAALTAAGLDTQEKRDAKRAELEARGARS